MAKVKLGLVSFLNVAPLYYPLIDKSVDHDFEIVSNIPSTVSRWLEEGRIDIGLIPVFEYFRSETYRIIPGVGISSLGPVKSVVLHHRCPPEDVKRVFLDRASRTSAALTRVILKLRYGVEPEYVTYNPLRGFPGGRDEAALVIGDRAFVSPPPGWGTLDLGGAWKELTGLPFVYAVFTVRDGFEVGGEGEKLRRAKKAGLAGLAEIARREAEKRNLDESLCRTYLEKNVNYDLSEEHIKGIKEFIRLAKSTGILNGNPELRFARDAS